MARKAPTPMQAWAQSRAVAANRNYGNRGQVRRGIASGQMGDITRARKEFVDPETDIWATLPVAADDKDYGRGKGTPGRFELAVDAFEWADQFFDYDDDGFNYQNLAAFPVTPSQSPSMDQSAAPITIVPTNTINPDRPRTVAAGYDRDRQVITVVFRDGTFYNYYAVTPMEWQAFKMSRSKGRYIKTNLDPKPRGIAQVDAVPVTVRAALYSVARTAQVTGDERWQQANLIKIHNARQARQSRKRSS